MKKYLLLFGLAALMLSQCTHRIVRYGYTAKEAEVSDCDIALVKYRSFPPEYAVKLGEVKLGEGGMAVRCSQYEAVAILRSEGCSLGADAINIVEETRPDFFSSCYRCKAEFYRILDNDYAQETDPEFLQPSLDANVQKDRGFNTFMIVGGLALGFLIVIL